MKAPHPQQDFHLNVWHIQHIVLPYIYIFAIVNLLAQDFYFYSNVFTYFLNSIKIMYD